MSVINKGTSHNVEMSRKSYAAAEDGISGYTEEGFSYVLEDE